MLLFAFSACTPENKSVTEPLTPEETEEIDKKYPGFSYNYETYIYPKVNKLSKSSSFYLSRILSIDRNKKRPLIQWPFFISP